MTLGQPARPQLCAGPLKASARQSTSSNTVSPEVPERLAQLAPARHVDDLYKVDDRKRANDALARPALFITVRDHELALLPDGPAHEREVQVLRLRRAPRGRVQADVVDRLLGAVRQDAGHLGPDGLRRRFQALVAGSTEQAQSHHASGPTWEASPSSLLVSSDARISPVLGSTAKWSLCQVRLPRAPCFSTSHSPAP